MIFLRYLILGLDVFVLLIGLIDGYLSKTKRKFVYMIVWWCQKYEMDGVVIFYMLLLLNYILLYTINISI